MIFLIPTNCVLKFLAPLPAGDTGAQFDYNGPHRGGRPLRPHNASQFSPDPQHRMVLSPISKNNHYIGSETVPHPNQDHLITVILSSGLCFQAFWGTQGQPFFQTKVRVAFLERTNTNSLKQYVSRIRYWFLRNPLMFAFFRPEYAETILNAVTH